MPEDDTAAAGCARLQFASNASDDVLEALEFRPQPAHHLNPRAVNQLLREGLIRMEVMPSPYPSSLGQPLSWAVITFAGRLRLANNRAVD